MLDLSEGGVCLVSTERLEPGARVRLKIILEKLKDEFELSGEVCWCRQDRVSSELFLVGAQFVDLDSEQSRKLKQIEYLFAPSAAREATNKQLKS